MPSREQLPPSSLRPRPLVFLVTPATTTVSCLLLSRVHAQARANVEDAFPTARYMQMHANTCVRQNLTIPPKSNSEQKVRHHLDREGSSGLGVRPQSGSFATHRARPKHRVRDTEEHSRTPVEQEDVPRSAEAKDARNACEYDVGKPRGGKQCKERWVHRTSRPEDDAKLSESSDVTNPPDIVFLWSKTFYTLRETE